MAVITSEGGNVRTIKQVNDALYQISEKLKYYFMNLDPEDNFTPEELLRYHEKSKHAQVLELAADGLISSYQDFKNRIGSTIELLYGRIALRVSKGDLTNQMNLEPDALRIVGNRLEIYGGNITLDQNNNLTFRGTVEATAGSIAGWTINGENISGGEGSRIDCTQLQIANHLQLGTAQIFGSSDFSGCDIELREANLETDKTTVFVGGFSTYSIHCYNGTLVCGTLTCQGDVWAAGQVTCRNCYTSRDGHTWSDRRLKDNIRDLTDEESTAFVMDLKPYVFRYRSSGELSCGFIAQDIEALQEKSGTDYGLVRQKEDYLMLGYNGIIAHLVKVLNRQTREIEELCRKNGN